MDRFFNIAGPCLSGEHYMLPPGERLGSVMALIRRHAYFTLHAGRQFGKTTSLRWIVQTLNAGDEYRALWVDIQEAREQPDPVKAAPLLLHALEFARSTQAPELPPLAATRLLDVPEVAFASALSGLCAASDRPLVVLIDEADGLVGPAMVGLLTQLRRGYLARSDSAFPASLALVGLRTVRDYILTVEERQPLTWLGTTSPFNITAEDATLDPFTATQVHELLGQHTADTGQSFAPEAVAHIYEQTAGHPWLVNALAREAVDVEETDRSRPIEVRHIQAGQETIIRERRTNIDSLVARLREPRVRRVMDAMLAGEYIDSDSLDEDLLYVKGLGLIREVDGGAVIGNPIYREIVPRALTHSQQVQLPFKPAWYVTREGHLDLEKLMVAWQKFWRQDGHRAAAGFKYREAAPHLAMMAFLQRIVNGGGEIQREYALGRRALDLAVEFGGETHAIELKIRRDTDTAGEALEQLASYLDLLGLPTGWLVLFDQRDLSWSEKLFLRDEEFAGKRIRIVGC